MGIYWVELDFVRSEVDMSKNSKSKSHMWFAIGLLFSSESNLDRSRYNLLA